MLLTFKFKNYETKKETAVCSFELNNNCHVSILYDSVGTILICKGRVVDKQEEPIIGASVLVEGTSNGTVTDLNGDFTLPNVPSKGKVKISYVGYTTQVIPIMVENTLL